MFSTWIGAHTVSFVLYSPDGNEYYRSTQRHTFTGGIRGGGVYIDVAGHLAQGHLGLWSGSVFADGKRLRAGHFTTFDATPPTPTPTLIPTATSTTLPSPTPIFVPTATAVPVQVNPSATPVSQSISISASARNPRPLRYSTETVFGRIVVNGPCRTAGWCLRFKHVVQGELVLGIRLLKGHVAGILATYDFSHFGLIGDIGGGRGHLISAVLEAYPSTSGVLFDLPHVIEQAAGLASDRLTLQAGDFFRNELPACDAYLLMEVIHDWNDDEAVAILRAIRRAVAGEATLLVIEQMIPDDPGPAWTKLLDVHMLALLWGASTHPGGVCSASRRGRLCARARGEDPWRPVSPGGPNHVKTPYRRSDLASTRAQNHEHNT